MNPDIFYVSKKKRNSCEDYKLFLKFEDKVERDIIFQM